MSKFSEVRDRAARARLMREQRIERVREKVTDVVNSQEFVLTMMNHPEGVKDAAAMDRFSKSLAEKVADAVCDPIVEFLDICKARGMKESEIRYAVKTLNSVFGLSSTGSSYDDQLQALALFLQENPQYYDDLDILSKNNSDDGLGF